MSTSHSKRVQEKYRLKKLEFQENNKKALCYFNIVSTLCTSALAAGTLIVINMDGYSYFCNTKLTITLYLMLAMHATNILENICQLTSLEKLCCGLLCVLGFFIYEVAVITYMNVVWWNTDADCKASYPHQYWWLFVNIIIYFVFFFIMLFIQFRQWFASPSEKEVEDEVKQDEKEEEAETRVVNAVN